MMLVPVAPGQYCLMISIVVFGTSVKFVTRMSVVWPATIWNGSDVAPLLSSVSV